MLMLPYQEMREAGRSCSNASEPNGAKAEQNEARHRPKWSSAPAMPRAATRHPAVDHEFRPRHLVGRVRGEKQHAVRDVLRLSNPVERYLGLGHHVGVNRHVAA